MPGLRGLGTRIRGLGPRVALVSRIRGFVVYAPGFFVLKFVLRSWFRA